MMLQNGTGGVPGTILVVDDDVLVRTLAARVLELGGYNVIEADCGQKGLECFVRYRESVDMVLSDIRMPSMSGPEMIREILRVDPSARVALMSGYMDDVPLESIAKSVVVLAKPFTRDGLLRTVKQCLAA
jgi:DNA-binding NtrC family response regulator